MKLPTMATTLTVCVSALVILLSCSVPSTLAILGHASLTRDGMTQVCPLAPNSSYFCGLQQPSDSASCYNDTQSTNDTTFQTPPLRTDDGPESSLTLEEETEDERIGEDSPFISRKEAYTFLKWE